VPDLLGLDERLTPAAAHLFTHLFAEASPVRVEGDVQRLFNRTERGWLVTLINNRGVYKSQQGLAQVDRNASVEVTLSLGGKTIQGAREWTLDAPLEVGRAAGASRLKIKVPPGDVKIVEIIEGR
jgi:phage terminase large subunit-like protein